jgi:uncharacterized protein YhbP (UPF0306 family)
MALPWQLIHPQPIASSAAWLASLKKPVCARGQPLPQRIWRTPISDTSQLPMILDFYLLSHPESLHCRNLTTNPSLAVAVFVSPQNWIDPGRGVQLFGTCRQVLDADRDEAEGVYRRRYQPYDHWKASLKIGDPALDYRFYRFVPSRLKILDEVEFGDAVFVEAEIVRKVDA